MKVRFALLIAAACAVLGTTEKGFAEPGDEPEGSAGANAEEASSESRSDDDSRADPARARHPRRKHATSDPTESTPAEGADERFGHAGQLSLRLALVLPYRMVLRYPDSPYCRSYDATVSESDQQKFCGFGGPLAVDVGVGFAPVDAAEPFVWLRFGLSHETETDTHPLVIVGGGVRLYTMSDSAFKIYVEPAVGIELEGGGDNAIYARKAYKKDLLFHLAAGPELDFAKNVGVYADGGLTVGVLRSLASSLELKAGVQARF